METSIIERLEKTRYNLLKWLTIGWAIWFGTFILKDSVQNHAIISATSVVGALGWIIFIINLIKFLKLKRELGWDKKVEKALNDELHQLNMHKSFQIGFGVVIWTTVVFLGFAEFTEIEALLVTEITLYFGVLSVLISGLIYNRD
ncbi:MAG TPA: hypothetical protein VFC65_08835 [Prolixibacteraceae bacterium]|nr:hypothetical protein [Prolixibacteraceae bacterium]